VNVIGVNGFKLIQSHVYKKLSRLEFETTSVRVRDCNPGIPGFPNPGIPEIFQSRNPGIEPHSIQGFWD